MTYLGALIYCRRIGYESEKATPARAAFSKISSPKIGLLPILLQVSGYTRSSDSSKLGVTLITRDIAPASTAVAVTFTDGTEDALATVVATDPLGLWILDAREEVTFHPWHMVRAMRIADEVDADRVWTEVGTEVAR